MPRRKSTFGSLKVGQRFAVSADQTGLPYIRIAEFFPGRKYSLPLGRRDLRNFAVDQASDDINLDHISYLNCSSESEVWVEDETN